MKSRLLIRLTAGAVLCALSCGGISRRLFAEEREDLKSIAKKFNLSYQTLHTIEQRLIRKARKMIIDQLDLRSVHPMERPRFYDR